VGGAFQVSGLLSADKLDVKMYGPCKAREIGGSTLRVRRSRATKLLDLIKAREPFVLKADQIEGDIVELEHTVAEVVRGNRVAIGPGCRIGRVEYQQSLKTHKSASVGHSVRR
jgi:cytoskeletal protein CcmA (bactofilin family)